MKKHFLRAAKKAEHKKLVAELAKADEACWKFFKEHGWDAQVDPTLVQVQKQAKVALDAFEQALDAAADFAGDDPETVAVQAEAMPESGVEGSSE